MSKTRIHSFIESLSNVAIGYAVALLSQLVIFPHYGVNLPLADNMLIGLWFTLISIIRSYILRRAFNRAAVTAPSSVGKAFLPTK